jgi:dTDP-4-dehydrorhamnose reductase
MKALLIGANGQLGSDIMRTWPPGVVIPFTHADIEVTDRSSVSDVIASQRPDVVINTAAFHNVDVSEDEPERAFAVNAIAPMHVADACREQGSTLVHISTDYVFSGRAGRAYTEDDLPDAINVYGNSKAAGEQLVRTRLPQHFIIRTSGLYGVAGSSGKGGNFVERMLQLAREGRAINVVNDQSLSPTFTADLAPALYDLVTRAPFGTYHVTNSGSCSWYELARTIFEMTGCGAKLSPTTTEAFGARAVRPPYSVLENQNLARAGIASLRPWRDALHDYLGRKGHLPVPAK